MIHRLTIIGVGLLGGSIGLAAKKNINDLEVTGCGHSDGTAARERGAVDYWQDDLASAVRHADLIVVAAPVGAVAQCLADVAPYVSDTAIVTDVGSAKSMIVAAGEAAIRPPAAFVGSHPMAGGSQAGVAAARADLFEGAACVVTPTDQTNKDALAKVSAFWRTLGGRVIEQEPAEHDRLVALSSHLPHALAAALMAVQEEGSLAIRGRGFADTSRVAAGDAALWRDIFTANRDNVLASMEAFEAELTTLRRLLAAGDQAALFKWLDVQSQRRKALE